MDASVGVKWFLTEAGSDRAYELLDRCADGEIEIVVPVHFAHEVLSVVRRDLGPGEVVAAWEQMKDAGVRVVPLTDEVVAEAARQCESLGCAFYDALAPAVAQLLGATLVTADARAHRSVSGADVIG
jgi:predicted nucleic acid-binding protein